MSARKRCPGSSSHGGITDPLPVESSGLALAPDSGHVELNRRYDKLDNSVEPQFGSDSRQSSLEWEDAIRHAVLKSRSVGHGPARDVNGLMLSPEEACFGDKEMSLNEVRLEGLRQWNMDMDVEYQYETFVCRCIMADICMIRRT